jgi:hypothetical protein
MSLKLKIIYIILGLIAVLALVLGVWWGIGKLKNSNQPVVNNQQTKINEVLNQLQQGANNSQDVKETVSAPMVPIEREDNLSAEEITKRTIQRTALSFASVFGSYSSQSNFENLKDLRALMTDKMEAWADSYIAERVSGEISQVYFGVTSQALKAEIKSLTEAEAEVAVYIQSTESTGTKNNSRIYYQTLAMKFKKIGGAWRVDRAEWK